MINGSGEPVLNSPNPWPMKKNTTKNSTLPGDSSIWNNSLFDFSPLPGLPNPTGVSGPSGPSGPMNAPQNGPTIDTNGWQHLKGMSLTDSPWNRKLPLRPERENETTVITNHLQKPPGFENNLGNYGAFCSSCEEPQRAKAVAHCNDCKEDICEACYHAHLRVKLTKEHR